MTHIRDRLYLDVEAERLRQEQLWGVQHHSPQKWLSILAEEFGEVAKAINEHDERGLRAEVLECCAVALAWAEDIDAGPQGYGLLGASAKSEVGSVGNEGCA